MKILLRTGCQCTQWIEEDIEGQPREIITVGLKTKLSDPVSPVFTRRFKFWRSGVRDGEQYYEYEEVFHASSNAN